MKDSCDACHEQLDAGAHRFAFVEEGGDLCFECHDEHEGKVRHPPAEKGECTVCHDPHAGDVKGLLRAASVAEVCVECHEETIEDLAFLHGPVAAGECTACHNPHASDHAKLLLTVVPDVCLKCHDAMRTRITEKKHVHPPAKEECTACHNPHGARNKMMLTDTPPGLCLECHEDIEELMEDSAVKHDALTTGKSCTGCHEPHASDIERVLVMKPMDLCLSCHDKELESGNGKVQNIARLLRENPTHHGPIAKGGCTACHGVHGGDNFRMLIQTFPARFYASYDEERYALCFDCHDVELVEEEETDEATNFRNGERNLHYLHVNRKVKGRTCRACHNVHASSQPKLITDKVPFGQWRLPISFEQTSSGGSCQPGCHRRYRYDREDPVVNVPKPKPSQRLEASNDFSRG